MKRLLAIAALVTALATPAGAADSLPSAMLGTWCTQPDDAQGTPMKRCAPGAPDAISMTPHAMDSEGDRCRVVSVKTLEAARWLVSHVCDSQPSRTYGWTFFRDGETLYLTPIGGFTERDWTRRGRPATYTCAGFKVSPPERKDDDPVVSTEIEVGFEMDGKRPRLDVTHTTLKGEVYKRAEQYRDIRFWSATYSDNWSGVSVKNPRRTMVGRMTYDRDEHHPRGYIEQSFVNGRLERTTTSVCTLAAE